MSGNVAKDLLSSPSNLQILEMGELSEAPLLPRARGNIERCGGSSNSSIEDKSADDVVVEVGDRAGDWTISCRKDGSKGAGTSIEEDEKLASGPVM